MAAAKEIKRPKDFVLPFYGMTFMLFYLFFCNLNIKLMVYILFTSSICLSRPKQQLVVPPTISLLKHQYEMHQKL
jgi:hypothetical protein